MKYSFLIQEPSFFIDEFKDNGIVNLEQSIEYFHNYPFVEQLKEVQEKEIISRYPKIKFKSEDCKTLTIWMEDQNGYLVSYENESQFAQFYLSNNFNENTEGYSVEYFLELFFNQQIEDKLNLKNKGIQKKHNNQPLTFSFKETKKISNLFMSFPWLAISIIFLIYDYRSAFPMAIYVHLMLSLFWLPSFILYLSYWRKNENAIVKIDPFEKTLIYEKDGKRVKFNRNEIFKCILNEETSTSQRSNTRNFKYIHFILKDKREIIITNFISEPENIIKSLNLNYIVNDRKISFLPL